MKSLAQKTCWFFKDDGIVKGRTQSHYQSKNWIGVDGIGLMPINKLFFTPAEVRAEIARRVAELGRIAAEFDNSLERNESLAEAA